MSMNVWLKSVVANVKQLRSRRPAPRQPRGAALRLEALEDRVTPSITLKIDYSLDKNHFFVGHPERQAALEAAKNVIQARLNDSLAAITPAGGKTWTAQVGDPSSVDLQSEVDMTDLSVPADTVIIYAGGADLGGVDPSGSQQLGEGGPGGFSFPSSAANDQAWFDTVQGRGKMGATGPDAQQTAFAPWGGSVQFNTETNWWFGLSPQSDPLGPKAQPDFITTAEHEIGHVLGIGDAAAWKNQIANGAFTGAAAEREFGSAVPLDGAQQHFAQGTLDRGAHVTMEPSTFAGRRDEFTPLDFAALQDLGWSVNQPALRTGRDAARSPGQQPDLPRDAHALGASDGSLSLPAADHGAARLERAGHHALLGGAAAAAANALPPTAERAHHHGRHGRAGGQDGPSHAGLASDVMDQFDFEGGLHAAGRGHHRHGRGRPTGT